VPPFIYVFVSLCEGCEVVLSSDRNEALQIAARSDDLETQSDYEKFVAKSEANLCATVVIDDELAISCHPFPTQD